MQRRIDGFAEQYAGVPGRGEVSAHRPGAADQLPTLPTEHHKRIRHSNFIKRTFGETRRRVKVIGRLPGEASCLNLVWAVLDPASRGWRGMSMTPAATGSSPIYATDPDPTQDQHRRPPTLQLSEPSPDMTNQDLGQRGSLDERAKRVCAVDNPGAHNRDKRGELSEQCHD